MLFSPRSRLPSQHGRSCLPPVRFQNLVTYRRSRPLHPGSPHLLLPGGGYYRSCASRFSARLKASIDKADTTQLPAEDAQVEDETQASPSEEGTIGAHFAIPYHVNFGETIKLLGSSEPLGCWDIRKAVELKWSHSDTWYCDVRLGAGVHEFKFIIVRHQGWLQWEPVPNRVLEVGDQHLGHTFAITCKWGNEDDTIISEVQPAQEEQRHSSAASGADHAEQQQVSGPPAEPAADPSPPATAPEEDPYAWLAGSKLFQKLFAQLDRVDRELTHTRRLLAVSQDENKSLRDELALMRKQMGMLLENVPIQGAAGQQGMLQAGSEAQQESAEPAPAIEPARTADGAVWRGKQDVASEGSRQRARERVAAEIAAAAAQEAQAAVAAAEAAALAAAASSRQRQAEAQEAVEPRQAAVASSSPDIAGQLHAGTQQLLQDMSALQQVAQGLKTTMNGLLHPEELHEEAPAPASASASTSTDGPNTSAGAEQHAVVQRTVTHHTVAAPATVAVQVEGTTAEAAVQPVNRKRTKEGGQVVRSSVKRRKRSRADEVEAQPAAAVPEPVAAVPEPVVQQQEEQAARLEAEAAPAVVPAEADAAAQEELQPVAVQEQQEQAAAAVPEPKKRGRKKTGTSTPKPAAAPVEAAAAAAPAAPATSEAPKRKRRPTKSTTPAVAEEAAAPPAPASAAAPARAAKPAAEEAKKHRARRSKVVLHPAQAATSVAHQEPAAEPAPVQPAASSSMPQQPEPQAEPHLEPEAEPAIEKPHPTTAATEAAPAAEPAIEEPQLAPAATEAAAAPAAPAPAAELAIEEPQLAPAATEAAAAAAAAAEPAVEEPQLAPAATEAAAVAEPAVQEPQLAPAAIEAAAAAEPAVEEPQLAPAAIEAAATDGQHAQQQEMSTTAAPVQQQARSKAGSSKLHAAAKQNGQEQQQEQQAREQATADELAQLMQSEMWRKPELAMAQAGLKQGEHQPAIPLHNGTSTSNDTAKGKGKGKGKKGSSWDAGMGFGSSSGRSKSPSNASAGAKAVAVLNVLPSQGERRKASAGAGTAAASAASGAGAKQAVTRRNRAGDLSSAEAAAGGPVDAGHRAGPDVSQLVASVMGGPPAAADGRRRKA